MSDREKHEQRLDKTLHLWEQDPQSPEGKSALLASARLMRRWLDSSAVTPKSPKKKTGRKDQATYVPGGWCCCLPLGILLGMIMASYGWTFL